MGHALAFLYPAPVFGICAYSVLGVVEQCIARQPYISRGHHVCPLLQAKDFLDDAIGWDGWDVDFSLIIIVSSMSACAAHRARGYVCVMQHVTVWLPCLQGSTDDRFSIFVDTGWFV